MAARKKKYWLVKTEPSTFSIDDWRSEPERITPWDGVRNYQARNFMRDEMAIGDEVIVYHSNAEPPAAVGLARVCSRAYPDATAFDPQDPHYDPKSDPAKPTWYLVDLQLVDTFPAPVPLERLRDQPALVDMELLRRGSRLSVQPVRPEEFRCVRKLGRTSKP